MGRCSYSIIGLGMTEQEAYSNACEHDRCDNGLQEGYNGGINSSTRQDDKSKCIVKPKPPKRCIVNKNVQQGTRKWETVYEIRPWSSYSRGAITTVSGTQAEALKSAKELALAYNCEYVVNIKKQLVTGTNKIATVTPSKSTMGEWLFTGTARD